MYICTKCNRTFADPAAIYDDIGYKYSACPYCEDDRIEESEPCKQCSDPKPKDHEDYCDTLQRGNARKGNRFYRGYEKRNVGQDIDIRHDAGSIGGNVKCLNRIVN
jgi:DNA-directed RNA polymerase subunit RPC12/RpoP